MELLHQRISLVRAHRNEEPPRGLWIVHEHFLSGGNASIQTNIVRDQPLIVQGDPGSHTLLDHVDGLGEMGDAVDKDVDPHLRRFDHPQDMPAEAEAGDICAGVRIELQHSLAGHFIQRGHHLHRTLQDIESDAFLLEPGNQDACPDLFGQHKLVPDARRGIPHHLTRVDQARHGKPVLQLWVLYGVAADQDRARLDRLGEAPAQDFQEMFIFDPLGREITQIHHRQRPTTHRIDVAD